MRTQQVVSTSGATSQKLAGSKMKADANLDYTTVMSAFNEFDMFSANMSVSLQAMSFDAGFWSDIRI